MLSGEPTHVIVSPSGDPVLDDAVAALMANWPPAGQKPVRMKPDVFQLLMNANPQARREVMFICNDAIKRGFHGAQTRGGPPALPHIADRPTVHDLRQYFRAARSLAPRLDLNEVVQNSLLNGG